MNLRVFPIDRERCDSHHRPQHIRLLCRWGMGVPGSMWRLAQFKLRFVRNLPIEKKGYQLQNGQNRRSSE